MFEAIFAAVFIAIILVGLFYYFTAKDGRSFGQKMGALMVAVVNAFFPAPVVVVRRPSVQYVVIDNNAAYRGTVYY